MNTYPKFWPFGSAPSRRVKNSRDFRILVVTSLCGHLPKTMAEYNQAVRYQSQTQMIYNFHYQAIFPSCTMIVYSIMIMC